MAVTKTDADPDVSECADHSLRLSSRSFARLSAYITAELGIKMPESKAPMIRSRLLRRVRALGFRSIDEYCEYFFSSAERQSEQVHFIDAVTTNKTDFFREPHHFQYLTETVLPNLGREKRVTAWSAACSSGEEPYTLAMVLSEYAAMHPPLDFGILATDVSSRVLQVAKDGIYDRQLIAPVPQAIRRACLLQNRDGNSVRIAPALRRKVSFHRLNLMDADYGVQERFDIVFCRNVLIYFDRPTQQAVISKLCRNLKRDGHLFIGHSESLFGLDLPLTPVGSSIFRKYGE